MTQIAINRLLTNKPSLGETKADIVEASYSLADGDIVLRINHIAVTTNNITYAGFGDAMNYWQFFPTHTDGWGHMPVWGFADVEYSQTPGIEIGERFFGYFPIASHLIMRPERVSGRGFYDGAAHRRELTSAYNQYARCATDPGYSPKLEHYQSLLRPLYITSYMLSDFLMDNGVFGARQVVMSSASSKTAYGTAYSLKLGDPAVRLVALTSSANVDFVKNLGCYDEVFSYDAMSDMRSDVQTTYVDFSGNEALRVNIHTHFGEYLAYDCFAGSAQNTDFLRDLGLPGPKPEFFFAPVQIRKRNKDYGGAELTRRFSLAQNAFIAHIASGNPSWMRIEEHRGFADAAKLVTALHAGRCDPAIGNVIILKS